MRKYWFASLFLMIVVVGCSSNKAADGPFVRSSVSNSAEAAAELGTMTASMTLSEALTFEDADVFANLVKAELGAQFESVDVTIRDDLMVIAVDGVTEELGQRVLGPEGRPPTDSNESPNFPVRIVKTELEFVPD